jgi:beta-lactamase superfamily II metal-dependent hydrolase
MKRKPYKEFVSADSTKLFAEKTGSKGRAYLLWGDGVRLLGGKGNGRVEVKARGMTGWVEEKDLGGKSLLEVYFIDVGQGDGVLIKTPDFRHIMIDGGNPRANQNTGKNAADFVDWKFAKDYGQSTIELDAMIASHNDFDHYGGLSDLLDVEQNHELDAKSIELDAFYHAGLSWWSIKDKRTLGPTTKSGGREYYTKLIDNRASAKRAFDGDNTGQLQGAWGEFIGRVLKSRRSDGGYTSFARLSHRSGFLPGFEADKDGPSIRVLGPVDATVSGNAVLPKFKSDSTTTNGNSVLLRLDYGRTRILLTGDLNTESQNLLLQTFEGNRLEFQCDVTKGCHHGSDDVSFSFLQAMGASATVISSGDSEGHDHPRPRIVAASGATGHLTVDKDKIITPLVYSTELARSTSLGTPTAVSFGAQKLKGEAVRRIEVEYDEKVGLTKRKGVRTLNGACVVAGLIYGLVNVRTDGNRIVTATLNEGKSTWTVRSFNSRF